MQNTPISLAYRDSIRYRLSITIGSVIFISMMFSSIFISYSAFQREITYETKALKATAKVFSAAIAPHIKNSDAGKTKRLLGGISKFPNFKYAKVTTSTGRHFADIGYGVVLARDNVAFDSQKTPSVWSRMIYGFLTALFWVA